MRQWTRSPLLWATLLFAVVSLAASASQKKDEPVQIDIEFTDVQKQTLQFIQYYETIELTREQGQIKFEALSELPGRLLHQQLRLYMLLRLQSVSDRLGADRLPYY